MNELTILKQIANDIERMADSNIRMELRGLDTEENLKKTVEVMAEEMGEDDPVVKMLRLALKEKN